MAQRFGSSLAIAGAWGYIGQKFLDAARTLQLETSVYDPGPDPEDVDLKGVLRFDNEAAFYNQKAGLFHLALHPEHRQTGMDILLKRAQYEPIFTLCEKPMAAPEHPAQCREIVQAVARSGAVVLYDFPELFDPITRRILDFFAGYQHVNIESVRFQRSKDREDPANPRNNKRMVHIQYQESVHCLAFLLYVLARLKGSVESVFADGLTFSAQAEPYHPPNPEAYPYTVDGKCEYRLTLGAIRVTGRTDFKRDAPWSKQRTLRGTADGQPFKIEANYLEGEKWLSINGTPQQDVDTNSYAEVIRSCSRWARQLPAPELMQGLYPNPTFAHVTYQLSSALWYSSWQHKIVDFSSFDSLMAFDAGFAAARSEFPR